MTTASPQTIAFCGLGLMGAPMVGRLLAAGHRVRVWNRTPAKAQPLVDAGASLAATPAEAATGCDAVLLCLTDAQAVEQTVFGPQGIASAMHPGGWLIDHSSIAPDVTRAYAVRLRDACGRSWIDAPVSGGVAGAQAGTLAIMAGGDQDDVQACAPLLSAYAGRVTHMGDVGTGQITKLCNQAIVASTINAIAEAVSLAARTGVQASRLHEALAGGWADSVLLRTFVPRMTASPPNRLGAIATMLKDVENTMAWAQACAVPMHGMQAVRDRYRAAASAGLADNDISDMVRAAWPDARAPHESTGA